MSPTYMTKILRYHSTKHQRTACQYKYIHIEISTYIANILCNLFHNKNQRMYAITAYLHKASYYTHKVDTTMPAPQVSSNKQQVRASKCTDNCKPLRAITLSGQSGG